MYSDVYANYWPEYKKKLLWIKSFIRLRSKRVAWLLCLSALYVDFCDIFRLAVFCLLTNVHLLYYSFWTVHGLNACAELIQKLWNRTLCTLFAVKYCLSLLTAMISIKFSFDLILIHSLWREKMSEHWSRHR